MPATAVLTALAAALSLHHAPPAKISTPPMKVALTCIKTGEETSGQNKLCYYDCAGSRAAITISLSQLCPLSINR